MRKLFGLMAVVAALGLLGVIASGAGAEGPTSPESPAEVSPESPAEASPESPAEVSPESPAEVSPESPAEASPLAFHEGCDANLICVYAQETFGSRANPSVNCSASGNVFTLGWRYSARNRCGNKTNWLRNNGTTIACMNPGGDRPSPGAFNEVWVAAPYGSFC
jgi:hypothetical protein